LRVDLKILEEEDYGDYTGILEKLRDSIKKIQRITDENEKNESIRQLVHQSIKLSKSLIEIGEVWEAGEFLFSAAELLEDIGFSFSLELYKHSIKVWEKYIEELILQAKLHEIAEVYLRISEIYSEKFQDDNLKKDNILKSIKYLNQENKLLTGFSESRNGDTRKLTQNYENIADLYLRISNFKKAIKFYEKVIDIAKAYSYYDILSFSYQQISYCYEEIDEYDNAKDIILDGIDYFLTHYHEFEKKNDNLALAQTCQILKTLYENLDDKEQALSYKKEAGAYINLAERLEKNKQNFQKIARYYRGAGLCYKEISNGFLESASCFVLAGNYDSKAEEFSEAAVNFFDAANIFKDLNNFENAYKHFVKAGDNFWKFGDLNKSTESYLNAYDIAAEGNLEFNRYGIFNQIVRGLNKIAEDGIKNKQFYTAATLILESIKFYEQLDVARDYFLRPMVRSVFKYYYKAANLKKIGYSHIVHSYVCASLSSILNGKLKQAWKIISEIESDGTTIRKYKEMIRLMIEWVSEGEKVEIENFPYNIRRIIKDSEEIMYLMGLFKSLQPPINILS
jgi:tetratricopeptide (TPR) repeat protein